MSHRSRLALIVTTTGEIVLVSPGGGLFHQFVDGVRQLGLYWLVLNERPSTGLPIK